MKIHSEDYPQKTGRSVIYILARSYIHAWPVDQQHWCHLAFTPER